MSRHPKGPPSSVLFRQLDPGTFDVRSRLRSNGTTSIVGHVYVETGGTNIKIEHWALRASTFESPDSAQDMLVERRGTSHSNLDDFIDEMEGLESSGGSFFYIRAECETFSSLPS